MDLPIAQVKLQKILLNNKKQIWLRESFMLGFRRYFPSQVGTNKCYFHG